MRTQRYASVIGLKPEMEAEYRRLHADVSPGVLEALRPANVRNFSMSSTTGCYSATWNMPAMTSPGTWPPWPKTRPPVAGRCHRPLPAAIAHGQGRRVVAPGRMFRLD